MASPQINLNGYFGNISGPFAADEEIITKIQRECNGQIQYLSKIGIYYVGDFDLDISNSQNSYWPPQYVKFKQENNPEREIQFQIGKTRMLELQDVKITSIKFSQNVDDRFFIDYQCVSEGEPSIANAVVGTAIVGTNIVE